MPVGDSAHVAQKISELTANQPFNPTNPRPFLQNLIGKPISVRLKWNYSEYEGNFVSMDTYMNVLLDNVEEFVDGVHGGSLGTVLIRCNNVLWIRGIDSIRTVNGSAAKTEDKNGVKEEEMKD